MCLDIDRRPWVLLRPQPLLTTRSGNVFIIVDEMDWYRKTPGGRRSLALCLLIVCALSTVGQAQSVETNDTKEAWSGLTTSCSSPDAKNTSVSCYGVRIVRKIVQQLLEKSSKEPNIEIFDGVSLVEVPGAGPSRKGRLMKGYGGMMQFFEGRELRIKLPSFLPQNIESALQESLPVDQGCWMICWGWLR